VGAAAAHEVGDLERSPAGMVDRAGCNQAVHHRLLRRPIGANLQPLSKEHPARARSQQLFDIKFKNWGDTKWQVRTSTEVDNEKDSMIAGGILGPFTGEGATDLVIDDPFKNKQDAYSKLIRDAVYEQYTTALLSRLMPGGTITLQQTQVARRRSRRSAAEDGAQG
jgi:hypothetical protein